MAKYTIREAVQEDITGIALLRQNITEFRKIKTEEYISFWNSLIKNNPHSIQQIQVAENQENKIVAHYAMIPFKFMKDGKELTGGFLCQLMVHEEYRKELIFPRMEMKFLKDYKKLGYDFAFSLGNRDDVVKAHLSFGFRKMGKLPVFAKPYKLAGLARSRIKSKTANALLAPGLFIAGKVLSMNGTFGKSGLVTTEISSFDPDIDRFLANTLKYFPYCSLRNSSILNWRFSDTSKGNYRILITKEGDAIAGYAVLRRMKMNAFDVLAVVDILFSPDRLDAGRSLLNSIHRIAVQLDVEMSACMLNQFDPLCPVLKKCGYLKTPEAFSLFVHEPKGADHNFSEDSYGKWHLTWFDNDAV